MTDLPIPAENQILQFIHCRLCFDEWMAKKKPVSPRAEARLEVGWTPLGLQVRCVTHDTNVIHIDFQGQKHPANTAVV